MMKIINTLLTVFLTGVMIVSCETPKKEVVVISTKYGDMVVEFFDESAPKHVESFKMHARNG